MNPIWLAFSLGFFVLAVANALIGIRERNPLYLFFVCTAVYLAAHTALAALA